MTSITKPVQLKRASVACNTCRESKLKCRNNGDFTTCQRCMTLNTKCSYTLKNSQLKRKQPGTGRRASHNKHAQYQHLQQPIVQLPSKELIIQVVIIFFENQYKGIFPIFHKPTFLTFLRSETFDPSTFIQNPPKTITPLQPDPAILLSILALCARLHPEMPKIYGAFDEKTAATFQPNFITSTASLSANSASNASNYFGWHARRLLAEHFELPSLSRCQALCILSSHEWGEGNASRSHMYLGIAARMAMILGLDEESTELMHDGQLLELEVRRRAMWSIYMMDRCNASGRSSPSCVSLKDIHIRLPCDEKSFIFVSGQQQCFREDVGKYIQEADTKRLAEVSCCGFMLYLFEHWRNISKWVGETGGKLERCAPWDDKSPYYKFSVDLDNFEKYLPKHLRFEAMDAHIANGLAADFAYFHGLFFLCRIFLCREYFYSSPDSSPTGWWIEQAKKLFDSLDKMDLITKILKPMNLMVIAPFTGFHVFTTGATSLYIAAYPRKVLIAQFNQDIAAKYLKMAEDSVETLKSWRTSWGLGKNWIETLRKLKQIFVRVSDVQDDDLRHKMHDYGNIDNKQSMKISNLVTEERDADKEDILTMDFINNLDLVNIFPDWSDPMNI